MQQAAPADCRAQRASPPRGPMRPGLGEPGRPWGPTPKSCTAAARRPSWAPLPPPAVLRRRARR
eukprot:2607340-Lingulodinium_polyedra.AAC.1